MGFRVILERRPIPRSVILNRRDFFSKVGLPSLRLVLVTIAVASDAVSDRYEALSKRIDELDASHKKVARALLIVTSVSKGVDGAALS